MNTEKIKQLVKPFSILLSIGLFFLPWFHQFDGLSPEGHRILGVFLMAVVLWVSEAIPLYATAALIIFLQIILVSDKAMIPLPEGFAAPKYAAFYAALAHPVLMLFLGGFFLADGAEKFQLDRSMARVMLKPFGSKPTNILLGCMLITALLSMFMSNTATTATMMAVMLPVIMSLPAGDRMRAGLSLSIPFAANIGGMGTPVGTPPNAIALGALEKAGIHISFVEWMAASVPFMLIILIGSWFLIAWMFKGEAKSMTVEISAKFDRSWQAMIFYATFIITLGLWLTEPLHGIDSNIVGFVPVVILLCTGVFKTKELHAIEWHVLWLVAGGIALGTGVSAAKLDVWMIGQISWENLGPTAISGVLCLLALLVGNVISHSATANLLVPIAMSMAAADTVQISPVLAAVFIAMGSSIAMCLPISTPPNAIAYSTGSVKVSQMALPGAIIGVVGSALFVFIAPKVWSWFSLFGQ